MKGSSFLGVKPLASSPCCEDEVDGDGDISTIIELLSPLIEPPSLEGSITIDVEIESSDISTFPITIVVVDPSTSFEVVVDVAVDEWDVDELDVDEFAVDELDVDE